MKCSRNLTSEIFLFIYLGIRAETPSAVTKCLLSHAGLLNVHSNRHHFTELDSSVCRPRWMYCTAHCRCCQRDHFPAVLGWPFKATCRSVSSCSGSSVLPSLDSSAVHTRARVSHCGRGRQCRRGHFAKAFPPTTAPENHFMSAEVIRWAWTRDGPRDVTTLVFVSQLTWRVNWWVRYCARAHVNAKPGNGRWVKWCET